MQAAVVASDYPDAIVPVAAREVGGSVGRAVVDDDQFPGLEGLREDALDRLADEGRVVVGGHDRGNDRLACRLVHRQKA